jgi:hypothetical protein
MFNNKTLTPNRELVFSSTNYRFYTTFDFIFDSNRNKVPIKLIIVFVSKELKYSIIKAFVFLWFSKNKNYMF